MADTLLTGNLLVRVSRLAKDDVNIAGYQMVTSNIQTSIQAGLTNYIIANYSYQYPTGEVTVTVDIL